MRVIWNYYYNFFTRTSGVSKYIYIWFYIICMAGLQRQPLILWLSQIRRFIVHLENWELSNAISSYRWLGVSSILVPRHRFKWYLSVNSNWRIFGYFDIKSVVPLDHFLIAVLKLLQYLMHDDGIFLFNRERKYNHVICTK